MLSSAAAKAASVRGAVETADLVLLAVPYGAVKEVLTEIRPILGGKTVIDATNALSNTVFAQIYASQNPKIQGKTISVFVSGDNKEATDKVQALITKMGFDMVNAGPLKSARNIEPLAMLNISLGYGQGLRTSIGFTLLR